MRNTAPRALALTALTTVALTGALAACAQGGADGTGSAAGPPPGVPSPTATATHGLWPPDAEGIEQPRPFEVRYDGRALLLYPFTFCADQGCADGFDDHPPSVGDVDQLLVHVPLEGDVELTVGEVEADEVRDGAVVATAEELGGGWWQVGLTGPAEERLISLFAGGDGAGDMVAEVLWTGGG
ncbi:MULTISPECIES: hypothetical protein [unclassified Isoptericola]|uniref:hypothetical protein n=1 Tax=unclassified Isoptericola TaxID=2623355 RepID=UPI0036497CB0